MIGIIEDIIKFILTHRFIRIGINYIIASFLLFFVAIVAMIFYKKGVIYYNPLILFQKETYIWLWENYKLYIVAVVGIEQLILWFYFFYTKIKKTNPKMLAKKDEIIRVPLEEVMKLWLDENELQEFYAKSKENSRQKTAIIKDSEVLEVWINSINELFIDEVKLFIYEVIRPNFSYFSEKELQMVVFILTLLQDNRDCPSVTSNYHSDSNNQYKTEMLTIKMSAYEALAKYIPLLEHTLGVARNVIKVLDSKKVSPSKRQQLIPKAIISALAHDLGKIARYNSQVTTDNDYSRRRKELPHNEISSIIVEEIGFLEVKLEKEYIKEISQVVKLHHTAPSPENMLLSVLIEADWNARDNEKMTCRERIKKEMGQSLEKEMKRQISNGRTQEVKEVVSEEIQEEALPKRTQDKELELLKEPQNETPNESLEETKEENLTIEQESFVTNETTINPTKETDEELSDFDSRSPSDDLGLNKNGYYVAMIATAALEKEKSLKLISNAKETMGTEALMYNHKGNILVFFKSESIPSTETMLNKIFLFQPSKIGYLHLKGENNIYASLAKIENVLEDSEVGVVNCKQEKQLEPLRNTDKESIGESKVLEMENSFKNVMQSLAETKQKTDDNQESPFNAEKFLSAIFSKIKEKISEVSHASSGFYALPYKARGRILVSGQFLNDIIAEVTQCSQKEAEKRKNFFVKQYGSKESNPRFIFDIAITKGFYTSVYYLVDRKGKKTEYICIPFDRKALDIDNAKMDYYMKKETIQGYKIEPFKNFT